MKRIKFFLVILLFFRSAGLFCITPDELMNMDFKTDYSAKKVNELRLIRSMVMARHGYLFMESEIRDYFITNFPWYDALVWKNAELEWSGNPVSPIVYSEEEQKFMEKIDRLINIKSKENLSLKDNYYVPNPDHIYNRFNEESFPDDFNQIISQYGFVIVKGGHEQLFHLYDQNQYSHIPNFVTTDLFLQLMHMYFSYTLKVLEKEKLVGLLTSLSKSMYNESMKYTTTRAEQIREMATFNSCFFAVAYTLLTDEVLVVPDEVNKLYTDELEKINAAQDDFSAFFQSYLPYSLFVPRGHYTRTEEQKRYFKAMMWLQVAPYCLSDIKLLKNASFNAFILNNGKDSFQQPIKQLYKSIYEPIAYLMGDADNLSVMDICDVLTKNNTNRIELLLEKKSRDDVAAKLLEKVKEKDQIQPKIKLACQYKINFMPQRYLVDNDILQQFVDTTIDAEKAFPKGLEVLAVLGVENARNILNNHFKESAKWSAYNSVMQQQTLKFSSFNDWNVSVYNKWLQSLIKLNKVDKSYPYFMQNRGWKMKNLNTSLASWAELKHDAILYGDQPMAAEMGDGGDELPPPVTVGYVEPNLEFWNTCNEMLMKCDSFLTMYSLSTEELGYKSEAVKNILDFFISVSKKELNHEKLTDEEYEDIEFISGKFDYLSLEMLNPYISYNYWWDVTGPDKTIALVADVYTRNVPYCPKNGILHEATGYGNNIYVIVEIDGHLYLTKGAVFSYYEFSYDERLTDEAWQEMLENNEIEPVDWMEEITVAGDINN